MRAIAKIHYKGAGLCYVKGELELDESGEPKIDQEYVYMKSGRKIKRSSILAIDIVRLPDLIEENDNSADS